jgi:uncharacterized protein (TIGR04255 family)
MSDQNTRDEDRNKGRHSGYPNPPITEAVIEMRFAGALKDDDRRKAATKFKAHYPNEGLHVRPTFLLDLHEKAIQVAEEQVIRRSNRDENEIVLIGSNNFIVSQLAVYPGWSYFFDRFKRDWSLWRKQVGYRRIERIGVRYINRIDIPVENGIVRHECYLNIYIQMPPVLDRVAEYSLQAEVHLPDLQCTAKVNSASVPSPLPESIAFVLDVDIGRTIDVPQKDDEIYDFLAQVRLKKNEIFEACVTDAARERFHADTKLS